MFDMPVGRKLSATVSLPAVNVCGQHTDSSPAAALIKQEVSTFLLNGNIATHLVVAHSGGFFCYINLLSFGRDV